MNTTRSVTRPLIVAPLALLLFLMGSATVKAQQEARATVLAIAASLPVTGAKALVFFRSKPTGQHVIVMSARGANEQLVGASLSLIKSLERKSENASYSAVIPISDLVPTRSHSQDEEAHWKRQLAQVRSRPVTKIGNLGMGRWVAVSGEPHRRR